MNEVVEDFTCECGREYKVSLSESVPNHLGGCTCGRYYMLEVQQELPDEDNMLEEPLLGVSISPFPAENVKSYLENTSNFAIDLSQYVTTKSDGRPTLDEYYMSKLDSIRSRSTCLRVKQGALLVKDGHEISSGYNGAPKGCKHCLDIGCIRDKLKIPSGQRHEICRASHAEANAIIFASRLGASTVGSTLYCLTRPCSMCAKTIINAGIVRVVYKNEYPDELAVELLEEAGVTLEKFKEGCLS